MKKIKGISRDIVKIMEKRSNKLGQGRAVGTIAFVDNDGYITRYNKIIDGGMSGLPFRTLLSGISQGKNGPLISLINLLPENAVIITTSPGKTGIIISTGGINIFDRPVVKIGIKNKRAVGAGILYPEENLFKLASLSEKVQLKTLAALTMEEEREALRNSTKLRLKYLEISNELPIVEKDAEGNFIKTAVNNKQMDFCKNIRGIKKEFARKLVKCSSKVEQGREVAAVGLIKDGIIKQAGEIIVGGMGYVPSRLLLSGYQDITNISLKKAYADYIPENAVVVHTHPGGTGVMHMGDAMAGPGTWGRPIVAIGHDEKGEIKGATVVEYSPKLAELADEYEKIEQKIFQANKTEEESKLRKRRYQIAQEYTDLCREIIIK
ncbi:MAG: peptidase S7 [bacterium]